MIESVDPSIHQDMVSLRQRLHAQPELSGEERETAATVTEVLRNCEPDLLLDELGGTGVAAVFDSREPGPAILFRAELDALPIEEVNDFEYRSKRKNVSHKCGHDGHMVILLSLAQRIARRRPSRGKIILLFQPAEETGEGAMRVLRDPRFTQIRPDYVFALHNLPGYPLGAVIGKSGAFTAGVRSLVIRLRGKTSHAAEPENGINPAQAIAELLQLADKLTQPDPASPDFTLVTPVHVIMGEKAYGVSAGYGEVHLTIRCWSKDMMQRLAKELLNFSRDIALGHGLEIATEWTNVFYANHNDASSVALIEKVSRELRLEYIGRRQALKWGEDFGAFTQRFKGAMFGLGAGEETPALHNPDYDFPDEIIETGSSLFFEIAKSLLEN